MNKALQKITIVSTILIVISAIVWLGSLFYRNNVRQAIMINANIKQIKHKPIVDPFDYSSTKDQTFYNEIDGSADSKNSKLSSIPEKPTKQISPEQLWKKINSHSNYGIIDSEKKYVQIDFFLNKLQAENAIEDIKNQYLKMRNSKCEIIKIDLGKNIGIKFRVICTAFNNDKLPLLCKNIEREFLVSCKIQP